MFDVWETEKCDLTADRDRDSWIGENIKSKGRWNFERGAKIVYEFC